MSQRSEKDDRADAAKERKEKGGGKERKFPPFRRLLPAIVHLPPMSRETLMSSSNVRGEDWSEIYLEESGLGGKPVEAFFSASPDETSIIEANGEGAEVSVASAI